MKKLLFTLMCTTALISCKKEKNEIADASPEQPVTASENPPKSAISAAAIQELDAAKTSALLQAPSADTLYVTNFFATWCPPCVREIPHFKDKMEEMKGQPMKFTFVSLDNKDVWNTDVQTFVDKYGIRNETVLLDGNTLDAPFFSQNFKTWKGESIPFTLIRKGNKTEELTGLVTPEILNEKIASFR